MFDKLREKLYCKHCLHIMKISFLGNNDGVKCICERCNNVVIFSPKELVNEIKPNV
jgi:hypothetical protein